MRGASAAARIRKVSRAWAQTCVSGSSSEWLMSSDSDPAVEELTAVIRVLPRAPRVHPHRPGTRGAGRGCVALPRFFPLSPRLEQDRSLGVAVQPVSCPASQPFLPAPGLPGPPFGPAPSITSQTMFRLHADDDGRLGPKAPGTGGRTSWFRRTLRQRSGPVHVENRSFPLHETTGSLGQKEKRPAGWSPFAGIARIRSSGVAVQPLSCPRPLSLPPGSGSPRHSVRSSSLDHLADNFTLQAPMTDARVESPACTGQTSCFPRRPRPRGTGGVHACEADRHTQARGFRLRG